ncbi:MAG: type II toxin-antitoxin system RelE family toxin [Thermoleophilia bacterium]
MAKTYKLVPSKKFHKDAKKLPAVAKANLAQALTELKKDPYSGRDLKKLTNVNVGQWRLRFGDYRLRYDIEGQEIWLISVRHRKDIYRKK